MGKTSLFVIIFNYAMVIIELLALFLIPLQIAFNEENFCIPYYITNIICIFYGFDIVLQFNIGYEDKGYEISKRK